MPICLANFVKADWTDWDTRTQWNQWNLESKDQGINSPEKKKFVYDHTFCLRSHICKKILASYELKNIWENSDFSKKWKVKKQENYTHERSEIN